MPFSSGTYTLASGNPVVTATTISSTWANNTLSDIATALSTCVLKDGTQTITANIPMSSFKFTGLAAGSANGDSVRYEQALLLAVGGTVSAAVTMSADLSVPDANMKIVGSGDATKILQFEVDGITTGTTRVLTPPDADLTLPAVTAKGDVPAATAAGVLGKIAAGTNGNVLMADSSQTTGLNYGGRGGVIVFSTLGSGVPDTAGYSFGTYMTTAGTPNSDSVIRMPFDGVVKNLMSQCGTVSAGTRTYTVAKNGSLTALTCASTGASTQANDTTHSFSASQGDYLYITIAASGGTETVGHTCTVEVVKTVV